MFRRLSSSLPKDPEFPADLEKLGYRINENDEVRTIDPPHLEFHFHISKNERVLETHREAFHICIRGELALRYTNLGLRTIRLPQTATPDEPHVPILVSGDLSTASRIIFFFGGDIQDLGVLAYRTLSQENLNAGSIVNFVKATQAGPQGAETAVVVANLGQLIWYRRGKMAVTMATWNSLPRRTGVDGPMRIDPVKNRVPGNGTREEHVASVMEFVKETMKTDAMIDVVGVEEGAEQIARYLDKQWKAWEGKVRAICLGLGFVWYVENEAKDEKFKEFWGKRARIYYVHHAPTGTPLYGREDTGCNCYSSGEDKNVECIMPKAYGEMLAFFELVHDFPGYEEVDLDIKQDENDDSRVVSWINPEDEKRDSELRK